MYTCGGYLVEQTINMAGTAAEQGFNFRGILKNFNDPQHEAVGL